MNKSTILVEIKLYSLNGSFIKFSKKNYIGIVKYGNKYFVIQNWILNEKKVIWVQLGRLFKDRLKFEVLTSNRFCNFYMMTENL